MTASLFWSDPPAWLSQLWGEDIAVQQPLVSRRKSRRFWKTSFLRQWISGVPHDRIHLTPAYGSKKPPPVWRFPCRLRLCFWRTDPILVIYSPGSQYQERVQILQTARSSALEHEKLLREIQKKEILLHCIIHDLSQPLSVMSVALDCVAGEAISQRTAEFIELGRRASDQQQSMIREVLQAFSADLRATLDAETSANNSPDLFHVARQVAESQSPPFAAKNVRFETRLAHRARAVSYYGRRIAPATHFRESSLKTRCVTRRRDRA